MPLVRLANATILDRGTPPPVDSSLVCRRITALGLISSLMENAASPGSDVKMPPAAMTANSAS